MPNLNLCQFIGHVGQTPETATTTSGRAVAKWSLAVNEKWKDASGQRQEKTEWVRCVAWGRLAEIVGQYVTKGTPLYVSGRMQTRKWQGQDGQDRYTTEIVVDQLQMLGGRQAAQDGQGGHGAADGGPPYQTGYQQPPQGGSGGFDDDVPF